jgi:hypothetical protein
MSDYERAASGSDEETFEEVISEKKEQIQKRRGRKPGTKNLSKADDEESIFIKEFDLNTMPPFSPRDQKNGVKIVVIGKPGTGDMICL